MSGRTYEDGQRRAVRASITWLHDRAKEMNDPNAAAILNTAAFNMGVAFKAVATGDGVEIASLRTRIEELEAQLIEAMGLLEHGPSTPVAKHLFLRRARSLLEGAA